MSYYPSNCQTLDTHHADPCEQTEYGRIRSAGFILQNYTLSDPTSPAQWQDGIASRAIIVIAETNGDSPKAAPVMGPAYGRRPEVLLGYEFTARYSDPNYASNCAFYNSLIGNMNYKFFFRTSSQLYITDVPVSAIPNRDIKNDLNAEITWEVEVKWIDKLFPCGHAIPDGIFEPLPFHYTIYQGSTVAYGGGEVIVPHGGGIG